MKKVCMFSPAQLVLTAKSCGPRERKKKKAKNRVVVRILTILMVSELIATKEMQANLIYTNERIRLINFKLLFLKKK
jgi:hypothetical protein